jgi:hypothetical protein
MTIARKNMAAVVVACFFTFSTSVVCEKLCGAWQAECCANQPEVDSALDESGEDSHDTFSKAECACGWILALTAAPCEAAQHVNHMITSSVQAVVPAAAWTANVQSFPIETIGFVGALDNHPGRFLLLAKSVLVL